MSNDTPPPGWAEWVGFQRLEIGRYRVIVSTSQTPPSWWTVRTGAFDEVASGYAPSVPEARRAALTALQTLLTTAVADVSAALANLNPTEPRHAHRPRSPHHLPRRVLGRRPRARRPRSRRAPARHLGQDRHRDPRPHRRPAG